MGVSINEGDQGEERAGCLLVIRPEHGYVPRQQPTRNATQISDLRVEKHSQLDYT